MTSGSDRYVEITPTNKHGVPVRLVHAEDIEGLTGFRSVYAYPIKTCKWIKDNWSERFQTYGTVNGMAAAQLPVYSDMLFMDFDNDEESAYKYAECLKNWNITHGIWNSGGRSIHLHIPTMPKEGPHVPYSQRTFVEEWGESIGAKADTSFYHAAGLFRLPGTVHEKTGNTKVCIGGHWGNTLDYDLVEPRRPSQVDENALASVWRMLLTPVDQGHRHLHCYKVASQASSRLGWSPESILEHLLWWNEKQDEKYRLTKDDIEVKVWKSI